VRIQFDSIVQGDLSLQSTCNANLVATAVSTEPVPLNYDTVTLPVAVAGSWTSWIEFADFGSAAQTDKAPQKRDPIGPKFSVTLGERIYASSFSLSLVDSNLVNAAIHDLPRPYPQIGATLGGTPSTGWFDFNLVRGQGAQFFP
jgi:hypothetical protein